MSKLAAALAWAARGFKVFPVQINSRSPLARSDWTRSATTDPAEIARAWRDPVTHLELDYNIGVLTTDLVVLDVDVKSGKKGLQTFAELGLDFDTLTVRTPSGGYHLYYKGLDRPVGHSPIVKQGGIDVRAFNGFVLAPGSTIDNQPYTVEIDSPLAEFPAHIRHLLKSPQERAPNGSAPSVELDTPEALESAAHFLQKHAPHAAKGSRGWTCYTVSCRLRDIGVSEDAARDMLVEMWNEFNDPPMPLDGPDGLGFACGNAYRYATGQPGSASPAAAFAGAAVTAPPPPIDYAALNGSRYKFGNMLASEAIEPRPWILGDVLLARAVTLLVAASKGGKSLLVLTIAAHMAAGKTFMGWKPVGLGRSIIYNAEDDLAEASRRLNAICLAYGMDVEEVTSKISLMSTDELGGGFSLTKGRPIAENEEHVNELVAAACAAQVSLIALDPLIEIHTGNENDSVEMKYVLSLMRSVARRVGCAVLAVHHTGKPPPAGASAWVGNLNAGRGSSSVPAGARKVLTLFAASDDDMARIGGNADQSYMRLDDGGGNYSRGLGRPSWLRWEERTVGLDTVGVLIPLEAKNENTGPREMALALVEALRKSAAASMSMDEAAAAVTHAGLMAGKGEPAEVKKRIARMLSQPIQVEDGVTVTIVDRCVVIK